jgi:hypothetical protein
MLGNTADDGNFPADGSNRPEHWRLFPESGTVISRHYGRHRIDNQRNIDYCVS